MRMSSLVQVPKEQRAKKTQPDEGLFCVMVELVTSDEGIELGIKDGIELGADEGMELGIKDGIELGSDEGMELGIKDGIKLVADEGTELGIKDGIELGSDDGMKLDMKDDMELGSGEASSCVPEVPIAKPISARLRAGASFVPSPVIAITCLSGKITILSSCFNVCTASSLVNNVD